MAAAETIRGINLQSKDGKIIPVNMEALVNASTVFKEMIENSDLQDNNVILPIQIKADNLLLIIKWVEYYKDFDGDPRDLNLEEEDYVFISKHDYEFTKELNTDALISLADAAMYMDIPLLARLCHKRIALLLQFRKPVDIGKVTNVHNDFTQHEENIIRRENEWYEDMMMTMEGMTKF